MVAVTVLQVSEVRDRTDIYKLLTYTLASALLHRLITLSPWLGSGMTWLCRLKGDTLCISNKQLRCEVHQTNIHSKIKEDSQIIDSKAVASCICTTYSISPMNHSANHGHL